jgi:hypothetical protein
MNNKIKRVYIAGPLGPTGLKSQYPAIDFLYNASDMIRISLEVFFAGFVPFCPALDMLFFLLLRRDLGEQITDPMIKRYSIDWLEVCDAMLLCPGWEKSRGALAEIEFAKERGIPIFEDLVDLKKSQKGVNHEYFSKTQS